MGRPPCCDKSNVKRGLWTAEEDNKILAYVSTHGTGNWTSVPKKAGLKRCGKSCRLRYTNYLRPDLKRECFTPEEEELIITLHATIGSRWSIIAQNLPGRTDNDVKNYWNTKLKKKLFQRGIDPITHKPISQLIGSLGCLPNYAAGKRPPYHSSKDARISCLNRDLKNVFMSKPADFSLFHNQHHHQQNQQQQLFTYDHLRNVHAVGADSLRSGGPAVDSQETDSATFDLLAQLHAINFVTRGASAAGASFSFSAAAATPRCPSPGEAASSSSNIAISAWSSTGSAQQLADGPPCDLSWSDFLVDDVVFCLGGGEDEGEAHVLQQQPPAGAISSSSQLVGGSDEGVLNVVAEVDECGAGSGDASFVESLLTGDYHYEMPWEFPELLGDDEPLAFPQNGAVSGSEREYYF